MENIETYQQNENSLINVGEVKKYLLETSKWGKFLAIFGYIGLGILIILALFVMFGFSQISKFSGGAFPMGILGFVYLVIAVLYYFPVTYLYKFSKQIKKGLNSEDQQSITSGFENLKSLFKFMGIFTIVILSIYALAIIVALTVGMSFMG